MDWQISFIYFDWVCRTHGNTGHTPYTRTFTDWIWLVSIIFSTFPVMIISCSFTYGVYHFHCRNILFGPIPLIYLNWTCFDTSSIRNTWIPVHCNKRPMNTKRNIFLTSGFVCILNFLIRWRFCVCSSESPYKMKIITIRCWMFTDYFMIFLENLDLLAYSIFWSNYLRYKYSIASVCKSN